MPLTLLSTENVPPIEIRDLLINEGVPKAEVSCSSVDAFLDGQVINQSELIILISLTQEFIFTGGIIERIRNRLTAAHRLVLCTPRPSDYQRIFDLGVYEVISPADSDTRRVVERILGYLILAKYIPRYSYESLYGATKLMQGVYDKIEDYSKHGEIVLLLGETGTGKGLVSKALHDKGNKRGEFILINCGRISEELKDSELFGSLKGSFTGAIHNKKGLIEAAQDGTAFFDEIGDLNPALQTTLLDVLEHNEVRPVGATIYKPVNARFVFATHRNLEKYIEESKFRDDLFERINVFDITLPPLRKRKADIPLLVDHLVEEENLRYSSAVKPGPGAVDELFRYEWRRNVRELKNVVKRAVGSARANGTITDIIFRESMRKSEESIKERQALVQSPNRFEFDPLIDTLHQAKYRIEAQYFKILWNETKGSIKEICRYSGLKKSQVFEKLRIHDISRGHDQNSDGDDD